MSTDQQPKPPARLPAHSRAAAAQKLDERPLPTTRGVYYDVPHKQQRPPGSRLRRHLKWKNLHRNNSLYSATDRASTRWSLIPVSLGILALLVGVSGFFVAYSALTKAVDQRYEGQVVTLLDVLPKDNLKMYDMHGTMIFQATDQGLQTSEPLNAISPNLMHAEIAIEDQYFWSNPGYDITGIIRAALADLTHNHVVQGGSTITQQLIKNTIVGNEDTIIRKLQEIILAPQLTRYYSKQEIMDMYLNTTYYGNMAYGAESAAFVYFGLQDKPRETAAAQLDIAQSAMLAGIPSNPSAYDPYQHPLATFYRMEAVLGQMRVQHYITAQQEQAAIVEAQQPNFVHPGILPNDLAPNFVNYALNELATTLHVKIADLSRSGLLVSTTLDLPLQNKVLKIAQGHISVLAKAHNMSNAAEVLIDYHNGDVRVLLGNLDPNNPQNGQFDVATQGYRQPGSSFKPFVYATAFEKGLSPGSAIEDVPTSIQLCCGLPPYVPHNYDLRYHGLVTVRYALQNSFNVPAVKVLVRTGVAPSLQTAQNMGISSYVGTPNDTMVLGTLGVHLLDMTSAYGVFANAGVRIPAHAISEVLDTQGRVVYQFVAIGKRVISPQVSFLITNTLSDNKSRLFEFYDCNVLQLYSNTQQQCYEGNRGVVRPAAAKTGTSQNFADNWTIGYTTDYVMGVWAGNNNNSPMVNVTGVDGAAPIWHDSLLLAEQGRPITNFPVPSGVEQRTVHYPEGITTTDWYIKGVPTAFWGL
jgi:membrane peptidoglycan carboxypeptidase